MKVGSVKIYKKDVEDTIKKMADEIFPCPKRNWQKRPYEKVYKDCSNIVGEFALVECVKGDNHYTERNPLEFNRRIADSFRYDVLHHIGNSEKRIEFKRMCGTWFSMFNGQLNTFTKHAKDLDALVTGYIDEYPDHYTVIFSLVINPRTFEHYWTPSNYFKKNQPTHYYSHYNSQRDNSCCIITVSATRTKEFYDNVNFVIEEM
jgi:hypothetical protein